MHLIRFKNNEEHTEMKLHGGYSPCFIVERGSNFSKLLENYLKHDVEDGENNDINAWEELKGTKAAMYERD